MKEGEPKLERIASKLAVSPRTLERRLKEHGAGYKALLDTTRSRFGVACLKDRRHGLS